MTSRGPGRASRTPEMEEKEQLRRQIRLLQGLIDDYKSLHGSASAPGTSAALGTSTTSQWQPPTYNSSRTFSARYPRPSRRGFSLNHGPAWRKKYSLVNRPLGSSDPPGDGAAQPQLRAGSSQGPEPQEYILERQVQLNPDQNMVIKIKPPSKPGSASTAGVLRTSLEEYEDPPWNDHRPQEGEGESSGAQRQPSRQGRAKGGCSAEDPLLVCQKEAGKPRVVKSVSSVSENPLEPRRTVSESAVAVRARVLPSSLPQRGGMALGRKAGSHSVASSVTQLRGDGSANTGLSGPSAASSLVVGPARPAVGPRQTREPSVLVSCRTNKFQKNNYKWVAASAKSPRASRRALSPRAAAENVCKAPFAAAERTEKPQLKADPDAKPRRPAVSSVPGASPSKYKWKASSPSASSASSFRWQSEVGSKDRASQLSPIPSRSPPADRRAVEPSSLQPVFSETPLSAYKVKSRTKIIRRRGSASLPADKKSSPPPAAMAKSQFSLRRKQALRGKSSPVTKKTPNKGLMPVTKPRPCCLPPGRAYVPSKEASSLHGQRPPPTSKVIRTRYRIVKKTPTSPLSTTPGPPAPPSWRARRLSLSRSLALNTLRPATGGRAQTGSPRWRSKGYRCIGGVLYKVSANKLSKTCSRLGGDGGGRPLLRTGRLDPASSCSRSLASRAVQRSLAIVRQARQRRRRRKEEYCMYYNRFGRCNRGERCPYVHDPEKVAVCTRFVRGTCKKTDGTCPFSHHVSKEKMPVCSYFLKGICSNSSCPYSHVYVSRKAEVCTDFLKGYCPLGAKCKKKHTLLCPDFSRRGVCPRGAQCQLLHRNPKRLGRRAATPTAPEPGNTPPRSRASTSHGPRKPSAALRPARRMSSPPSSMAAGSTSPPSSPRVLAAASPSPSSPSPSSSSSSPSPSSPCPPSASLSLEPEELCLQAAEASAGAGSGGLSKLPSFIALQSSPSPGGQPRAQAPRSASSKDSGKSLHIKPRL
ncbi:zinc finger CCCH domain-containing protein 3 [Bos indicus x Bos taurus]|uniref:Zinc finger CCCH domain-containing protein 3 n=1 Tax=Bos indicus x Bos taurus TaxID=30522 RepID=A0A4W2F6R7_BOBOX|nr:zinc finger CCCH domain-containing protein 3 [Bos indicus x Bos taurus]